MLVSSGASELVFFKLIIWFLDQQFELLCPTRLHIKHFLFRKVQSLYQCRASHPEHGLGGKYFCLFLDLLLLLEDFDCFDSLILVGDLVYFLL